VCDFALAFGTLQLRFLAEIVFKLSEHTQHFEEGFLAAVLVSIGCSVARTEAPLAFAVRHSAYQSDADR
jgi:hypothetical protein